MFFMMGCMMAMAVGVCCFINPELAWQFYVMDSANIGINVKQPRNWKRYVYVFGALFIGLGLRGMMLGWTLY